MSDFEVHPPPPGVEHDEETVGRIAGPKEERPPVWDRFCVRWDWVVRQYGYVCSEATLGMPVCRESGAIPIERQPTFAHPPNEAQLAALKREEILDELHGEGIL